MYIKSFDNFFLVILSFILSFCMQIRKFIYKISEIATQCTECRLRLFCFVQKFNGVFFYKKL